MYLPPPERPVLTLGVVPGQCGQAEAKHTQQYPSHRAGGGQGGDPYQEGEQLRLGHQDTLAPQPPSGGRHQQWTLELLPLPLRSVVLPIT